MIVKVGSHEIHLIIAQPAATYVRFIGDVTGADARSISDVVRHHLAGRGGRILVNVAELGSISPEGRRELARAEDAFRAGAGCYCEFLFIRARLTHKVVLAQIISEASALPDVKMQTYFFESLDDALAWAGLSPEILFGIDLPVPRRRC
jgi:hypothetical protein